MAIDFGKTFGAGSNDQGNGNGSRADQPKATLWLNIGYDSGVPEENGEGTRFVSLPVGIPVDTQEKVDTRSRNQGYAEFQAARNHLLDRIMEAGAALAPGETVDLNLTIQLRKVAAERAPVEAGEGNAFVKPLNLVAKAD